MPSMERRVAEVEERLQVEERAMTDLNTTALKAIADVRASHTADFAELRNDIREMRTETMRRFEQVDQRFAQVDRRFEQVDRRFEQIDARFVQVDARFFQIDGRFVWLVGLQFAVLLAAVSALLNAYYR